MARFSFLASLLFVVNLWAAEGQVTFFIFRGDVPAHRVKIVIDKDLTYYTDQDGILEVTLDVRQHEARIYNAASEYKTVRFKINDKEQTFVNLTLLEDVAPQVKETPQKIGEKVVSNGTNIITIKGRVLSSHKNQAISGARVLAHGTNFETVTNEKGEYSLDLPNGDYSISILNNDFSPSTKNLSLKNQSLQEDFKLRPSGMELEEFVVLSPNLESSVSALLMVRRSHQTVADLIGADQISKTGDSDAGSSLKRVTGISLVDDKYVYVRGLGERYSSTLVNAAQVPSPDPSRRVVPLDLFPANVIESMVVQKGYSPEMPGEFGGGSIEIKTKTIPDKKYVKVSLSQSLTPFEGAQTYEGESSDWSGFHGARREMPALLKNYVAQGKNISTVSPEERRALAQSINKSYKTSEVSSQDLSQIPNMSLSMGNKYRHRKWMWGYNFSSLYSNKWSLDTAENWSYDQTGTDLTLSTYNEKEKSKNTVKMGAMLGVGVEYKKQKFSYNGMLLRNTLNYVYEPEGFGNDNKQYGYKEFELGWSERFVESHQISGEHIVNDLYDSRFIWNATLSKAVLDEPDNKFYTYIKENDVYKVETENGSASNWVSWNHMPDSMKNFGLNYSQSFDLFRIKEAKFKFGVNHMDRVRVYSSHTFYYRVDNASLSSQGSDVDDIFSDPDAQLYQQANATNSYSANHSIDAYYTNFIFPLSNLTLTSGFRFERSFQQVESFRLFGAGKTISTLETQDYLPVVSATYKLTQKSQIRFNFSETVSRPDLREISKTTWVDSEEGAKYTGNPSLLAAEIQNIGMRWEWFPQTGEVLSLGYFQKNFVRPIEEIFGSLSEDGRVVGTTETRYTFLNIDEAINRGIEFEFRKKLPKNFYFGGNYSWIDSQASISKEHSGQLTSLERTLQGQSPYLMNLQFDYEPPKWKASFSLLYNAMGRRITGVGANGRPDEYQEEVSSLDFTASKEVYKNWKFEFKAKNILDPEVRRTQGDKITYFAKKGQEYSVGLSGRF